MRFAAIDVETANADLSSICQVGVAFFEDGVHTKSWSTLVDPEDEFDGFNVSIHGIDEQAVRGAPKWPAVIAELRALLSGSVAACHTPFDRAATTLACEMYRLEQIDCRWLDTARVVRNLEKKMLRAERRKQDVLITKLGKLRDVIFPAGGLQERHSGLPLPFLAFGEDWLDAVQEHTDPFGGKFTVLRPDGEA